MGKIVEFKWPKNMSKATKARTLKRIAKTNPSAAANYYPRTRPH